MNRLHSHVSRRAENEPNGHYSFTIPQGCGQPQKLRRSSIAVSSACNHLSLCSDCGGPLTSWAIVSCNRLQPWPLELRRVVAPSLIHLDLVADQASRLGDAAQRSREPAERPQGPGVAAPRLRPARNSPAPAAQAGRGRKGFLGRRRRCRGLVVFNHRNEALKQGYES